MLKEIAEYVGVREEILVEAIRQAAGGDQHVAVSYTHETASVPDESRTMMITKPTGFVVLVACGPKDAVDSVVSFDRAAVDELYEPEPVVTPDEEAE